jgi:hypothetical protein
LFVLTPFGVSWSFVKSRRRGLPRSVAVHLPRSCPVQANRGAARCRLLGHLARGPVPAEGDAAQPVLHHLDEFHMSKSFFT